MTFYDLLFSEDLTTIFTVDKAKKTVLKQHVSSVELVGDTLYIYLLHSSQYNCIMINMVENKKKTYFRKSDTERIFLSAQQAQIYFETSSNIF